MDSIFLSRRWKPVRLAFLGLAVLFLFVGIAATSDDPANSKIDKALMDAVYRPIFVRMKDQLINQAGDFEKFCQEHQKQKRSELRPFVIKTLREKSDASWKKISSLVDKFVKEGQIKNVQRFWIVNGFACNASVPAFKELAASEEVSFVYLQPNSFRENAHVDKAPAAVTKAQKEKCESVLKGWKDDSDEPFSTKGLEIPWNLRLIQADLAWEMEKVTGKGIVVALIDSGIMVTPSLMQALWKNSKERLDGKDDDGNGYIDDLFGYDFQANSPVVLGDSRQTPHGSMCAGIIAGRPSNSKNLITGVAPRAKLMILRGGGCLKGYEYALLNGADAISMSYTQGVGVDLGNYRGLYRTAHEHLAAAGIVASGGAGNWSYLPKGMQIGLPKDVPCVLATAGILKNGKKAPPSGEGPCYWQGVKFYDDYPKTNPLLKPDVTAPFGGYPIWGRPSNGKLFSKEGKNSALVTGPQGNSFSAPHTAGVAALILSANPELSAWEVKAIMEQTCKDLGPKGRDATYGAGLLQALDAVRAAKSIKK